MPGTLAGPPGTPKTPPYCDDGVCREEPQAAELEVLLEPDDFEDDFESEEDEEDDEVEEDDEDDVEEEDESEDFGADDGELLDEEPRLSLR